MLEPTLSRGRRKAARVTPDTPVKLQIVREVERAFDILNHDLFGGRLVRPPVVFQPKLRHTVRWFQDTNDLSIGAGISEVAAGDLLADMLHEMVHIYNAAERVVDCTSNDYHNRKFLSPALKVGLVVVYQKTQGWGLTQLTVPRNVAADAIEVPDADSVRRRQEAFEKVNFSGIVLEQAQDYTKSLTAKKPVKVYFQKYACGCPGPHNSIRCGRKPDGPNRLNAICGFCNQPFVVVDMERN